MTEPANASGTRTKSAYMVGLCGGSGMPYGVRLLVALLETGAEVHVSATGAAIRVLRHECGIELPPLPGEGGDGVPDLRALVPASLRTELHVHAAAAVDAAPASGSAAVAATILCPCSMGTLARVAHGFSSNLIERAADVAMKERRPLIVVPRETPLSVVHLRNMLLLAESGAVVLPAMPGFYHRPETVSDLVDFVVARVLDRLGVQHQLVRRWRTPEVAPPTPWHEGEEET